MDWVKKIMNIRKMFSGRLLKAITGLLAVTVASAVGLYFIVKAPDATDHDNDAHSHGDAHAHDEQTFSRENPAKRLGAENTDSFVKEGVAMEFRIGPVPAQGLAASQMGELADGSQSQLLAGADAQISLSFRDEATGTMLSGLRPAAWMDMRKAGQNELTCKDKIEGFIQGTLSYRPEIDLNTWYVMVLNEKPSITVIDPLLGFGGQKTIAMVLLDSPGADWVITPDQKKVYVTLPLLKRVSVVDTATWKVSGNIDVGATPGRIALQADGRYLWVTVSDGSETSKAGGVAVIDVEKGETVARIDTGDGPQTLAFSDDDRYAMVTNAGAGTASLIDVAKLTTIADVKAGARPVSVSYSALSNAFYVADEATGALTVVAADSGETRTRLNMAAGLKAVGVSPNGRWVFAANADEDKVHILDSSTNIIVQSVATGGYPYQIAFTDSFAYIRMAADEKLGLIPLAPLDSGKTVTLQSVAAGRSVPGDAKHAETTAAIVPSPEGNGVLVTNPLDRAIYYYMEGMAAASGSFNNENNQPRGVLAVDKSMKEVAPGQYGTNARLPGVAGVYDVAVLLDSPRVWHCFSATVHAAPGLAQSNGLPVKAQFLVDFSQVSVGEETTLRLKLLDTASGEPKPGVEDLTVLSFLAPGIWKRRTPATDMGDGIYEVTVTPPQTGAYYVFVESASLGLNYRDLPFLVLRATPEVADNGKKKKEG